MTAFHEPVLTDQVASLARGRQCFVDGTVGGGGHAARLLETGGVLLAIDRDPEAIVQARARLQGVPQVTWLATNFAAPAALAAIGQFQPDFVLLDLGVSSHQIDEDIRGFSFRAGVPLDMRMTGGEGESAAALLDTADETELTRIFAQHGDETRARRLAATIRHRRVRTPFRTSDDLVKAIRGALGPRTGPADFARLFQAVRIAVNDELGALEGALPALLDALIPGGALVVISYHSGEDRVVKHHFQEWSRSCVCPPGVPVCTCRGHPLGIMRPRQPIRPDAAEVARNPRARSAKLRVFYKADAA